MAEESVYKGALIQEKALPHGAYNALAVTHNPKKQALDLLTTDPFNLLKEELYKKNTPDVFDMKTEWNAIVLKTLDQTNIFSNPFTIAVTDILTQLLVEDKEKFIGFIPEIHGCLLTPIDESDFLALSQYPVFEGASSLGKVKAGDIVRVTFDNLNNFSGPKYIGPSSAKGSIAGLGTPTQNAEQAFNNRAGMPTSDFSSKPVPTFGAWTGAAALNDPEKTLKLAENSNMKILDIFVQDHPGTKDFYMYDEQKIRKAVTYLKAGGIDVWLTTWIKPTKTWIEGMRIVGRLAEELGVSGICLDMEDPWIYGFRSGVTGEEIEALNVDLFNALRESYTGQIGVSVIISQNDIYKVQKSLELCDVIIPQAYATKKNAGNRTAGGLEASTVNLFQKYGKRLIMGGAAWNLDGAYGTDKASALQISINTTRALGITEIRYWRLEFFYDPTLADVIKRQKYEKSTI